MTKSMAGRDETGDRNSPHEAGNRVPIYHVVAHLENSLEPQECEQSQPGHHEQHHIQPAGALRLTHKDRHTKTNASRTGKRLEAVCLAVGTLTVWRMP